MGGVPFQGRCPAWKVNDGACPEKPVHLNLPLEPNAAYLFFQLISRCYQRGSVLITSNRPVMEWGEVFGDQVVATAILDRLLHHSHVLTIRGDSYRLREKRRSGLLRPQVGGSSAVVGGGKPPPTTAEV